MKRVVAVPVVAFSAALLAAASLVGCDDSGPRPLSVATGNPAGVYYPFGGAIASRFRRDLPGVVAKAEVTAGSVTNLIQVARGESDLAFSQADAFADAAAGRGRFPDPLPVVILGRIYPNVVHLLSVAGRGVASVSDLRGRRVSVGPPGSGNEVTARNVLRAIGVAEEEIRMRQMNYTQSIGGLKDGTLDAVFLAAGLGVSSVVELGLTRDLVLVPFSEEEIRRVEAQNAAYQGFEVPAGAYPGVEAPVLTPSLWNLLVVHRDMPDELARGLAESVFRGREDFGSVTANAGFISIENLAAVGEQTLHPAALAFYEEERLRNENGAVPGNGSRDAAR